MSNPSKELCGLNDTWAFLEPPQERIPLWGARSAKQQLTARKRVLMVATARKRKRDLFAFQHYQPTVTHEH